MSNIKNEISSAIAAHGQWKVRLKGAIDTGKIDIQIGTIKVDNACAFGKWFYGPTITTEIKSSNQYKTVKELHAQFHKEAAKVAELAIGGKKEEAEKSIGIHGEYGIISAKLTKAMMDWQASIK